MLQINPRLIVVQVLIISSPLGLGDLLFSPGVRPSVRLSVCLSVCLSQAAMATL